MYQGINDQIMRFSSQQTEAVRCRKGKRQAVETHANSGNCFDSDAGIWGENIGHQNMSQSFPSPSDKSTEAV